AGKPTVVTLTGTDLYRDLDDPGRAEALLANLQAADAIIVYHGLAAARLLAAAPALADRVEVVPPGVPLPPLSGGGPRQDGGPGGEVRFFLPAGLRPVKDVLFAIPFLARLREEGIPVRLRLAGAVMDPVVERQV